MATLPNNVSYDPLFCLESGFLPEFVVDFCGDCFARVLILS